MSKYGFFKERLKELGRSQVEMASYLGIDRVYLNNTISGKRELQQQEITKTARFLNYDTESFLGYVSEEFTDWHLIKTRESANNKKELDISLLSEIIEAVEQTNKDLNKNWSAKAKTLIISTVFTELTNNTDEHKKAQIIPFIRVIARSEDLNKLA